MQYRKKQHNVKLLYRLVWCFLILSASGCATVGQDYLRPEISVSKSWNTRLGHGLSGDETDPQLMAHWWKTLDDPVLTGLIDRACKNNLDLKSAMARLRQARAQRTAVKSGLFPWLDASGSASRRRSSGDTGAGSSRTMYAAGFDADWEIDLFGGVRRSVEAADADLSAAVEDVSDVLVSLNAEVALNYLDLRTYQVRLDVARDNLAMQEETFRLEQFRLDAGLSDELAVAQALANLESTRARIPALNASVEGAKNRIAVLLGEQPGKLHEELAACMPFPVAPADVVVGVPADVIRRRPDVRKAERELAAQTARVGVAESDLYPKFTLNGSIGYEALSSADLITAASRTWSYGPKITWPIFHAGSIRANIKVASALMEQALIQYEKTVLAALEDVEASITGYAEEQTRKESLENAAVAARQAVDLAQDKYDAGLAGFDILLDAQRTLLTYEDELVVSKAAVITHLISLYKALGGGWTSLVHQGDTLSSFQGETYDESE